MICFILHVWMKLLAHVVVLYEFEPDCRISSRLHRCSHQIVPADRHLTNWALAPSAWGLHIVGLWRWVHYILRDMSEGHIILCNTVRYSGPHTYTQNLPHNSVNGAVQKMDTVPSR